MQAGRLLRDKSYLTRLLVLRELHANPHTTLREVGERLDVTVQAVSNYVRALTGEGLVRQDPDSYPLTPKGVQYLVEGLREVKRAVDDAVTPLTTIEATSAVAQAAIRPGDDVALVMQDGDLAARPAAGAPPGSRGRAVTGAQAGEEVVVRDLQGVVELEPGTITVVEVPAPLEGGGRVLDPKRLAAWLEEKGLRAGRVGAEGTGAKVLSRQAGLPLHLEFAVPHAAFNAAEVGLDVLLLVTRDLVKDTLARLDARNRDTLRRVRVDVLQPPVDVRRSPGP